MSKRENTVQRAFKEDGLHKTHVGGQALIEGVMMRGKYNWAAAVREPNGSIHIEEHDLTSGKAKNGWLYWPIVRGCRAFVESLVLGFKALEVAAMHAYADSEEPESEKQGKALAASDSDSATCEGPQELGAKTAEAQEALVSEGSFCCEAASCGGAVKRSRAMRTRCSKQRCCLLRRRRRGKPSNSGIGKWLFPWWPALCWAWVFSWYCLR